MIKFLLLLMFSQSLVLASPRQQAADILAHFSMETDTIRRMDLTSQSFLGLPYGKGGPLGEGKQGRYDQDPIYLFNTFNCTTYIEAVVSLALSRNVEEFEKQLYDIRYEHGEVNFLKRNHFPSLQWIPSNVENGLFKEINYQIAAPSEIKMASAIVSYPGWLKSIKASDLSVPLASEYELQSLVEELHAKAVEFTPIRAGLEYIPLTYFFADPSRMDKIPHGSIVNFVRPNWDVTDLVGTHMNVSHQGFLFRQNGILYLRHASTSADQVVAELPFMEYLERFQDHPTLKGVHFMQLN